MKRTEKQDPLKGDSLNDGFTAIPHEDASEQTETAFDTTHANLAAARASGYIDDKNTARQSVRPNRQGSPTGAWTDIGAGRSSVVHPAEKEKTIEKAPPVGGEQAP